MKIRIEKSLKSKKGLLVIAVTQENLEKPKHNDKGIEKLMEKLKGDSNFNGKALQTTSTFLDGKKDPEKALFIGIGKTQEVSEALMRNVGGKAGKYAKQEKLTEVSVLVSEQMVPYLRSLVEGFLSSQYDLGKLKAKRKKEEKYELQVLNIVTNSNSKSIKDDLNRAQVTADSLSFVKDLVNFPSNIVDAKYMAVEAKKIAKENGYKLAVFGDKELKKMGWGGLLSVNDGTKKEAKCVVLQYDGAKNKKEKAIALVGKGMIFDTGGYSMKSSKGMETMQQDMAGGATVLGVFKALKKLGVKKNILGVVPLGENLVSDSAYRPSDIITMLSGDTVEITNTDAEGRLILADAITYATQFKPSEIVTIATLTGAVNVATGERYAGLIANNDALAESIKKAGEKIDDLGWQLPIHNDYRESLKSTVADMKNYDQHSGGGAGSSRAAVFLEAFTEKHNWCHIDIGGTAFTTKPKPYQTTGATGHGLGMLLSYLEN